jgi:HEPN domain-containing protein
MKEFTLEWVNKAEEDYIISMRENKAEPAIYSAVCFHCQQAAEKYLKAYMQEEGIEFEKTHDLRFLFEKVKNKLTALSGKTDSLDELSFYAVESRYPGPSALKEDAEKAVETMIDVRNAVRQILGIK